MKTIHWSVLPVAALCIAALLTGVFGQTARAENAAPDETALIAVLKSDADWNDKQTACRRLRQIGTVNAIPALAALLPDEHLSNLARFALEVMPYPEVDQALRDALATANGLPKIGVVVSLGVRRDPQAVALLTPLLTDVDLDMVRAAAGALGRIGTLEAADALMAFRATAPEAIRPALADGLLAAGERLAADGQGDQAGLIFQDLMTPAWPTQVQLGAFRGLTVAQPQKTGALVMSALLDEERPLFRDFAAQIVADTSGADMTRFYAEALGKKGLSTEAKVALLRGLAGRGDPIARPVAVEAAVGADKPVKLAALNALASLGAAADVAMLADLLGSDDADVAGAAKAALADLKGDDVNPAIAALVPKVAPVVRAQLIELLVTRRAQQAVPLAVAGLGDSDVSVRIASLRVLSLLGEQEQAPVLVAALLKTADPAETAAAEKALGAVCTRAGTALLPSVLDAMASAGPDARVALLRVAGRIGGPDALQAVIAVLADEQAGDEAVRILADWPTLDAAPSLLTLAKGDVLNRHVLGLRGYVRLAGIEPSVENRTAMLTTALELAQRPDEKKLVLAGWGALATEQSLAALLPSLDDEAVRNEAASAIVAVATELGKTETTKAAARAALAAVLEKCQDAAIRDAAQKALDGIGA